LTERYDIVGSKSLFLLLVVCYTLALGSVLFYVSSPGLLVALVILGWLLFFRENRRISAHQNIALLLNASKSSVEIRENGESQQYRKFRLYTSRWFAILQLFEDGKNRSLLLTKDRFYSLAAYQQFRFSIMQMRNNSDAA